MHLSPDGDVDDKEELVAEDHDAAQDPNTLIQLSHADNNAKAQHGNIVKGNNDDSSNNHQGEASCSICLQPYEKGDAMVQLPCGHIYHHGCVSVWITNNVRCPLCNFNLEEGTHNIV